MMQKFGMWLKNDPSFLQTKPKDAWNEDDKNKGQCDKKEKNFLLSSLEMDELFRESNCKTAKENEKFQK